MIVKMIVNEININKREKNLFVFNTLGKNAMKHCINWLKANKINAFLVIFDQDKNSTRKTENELLNSEILNLTEEKTMYFLLMTI